jgi:DNA-directed RNA polymerase subunit RPC12/RpoP
MSWRSVYLSYPCPTCGAEPDKPCLSASGRIYRDIHAGRTRNADRCPQCGTKTAKGADPGSLCERCALVRSLETERATVHRRLT